MEYEIKSKSIGDYLMLKRDVSGGRYDSFFIPAYQRGYSWTIKECDKLWQDIENAMSAMSLPTDDKPPYFFGTIITDYSSKTSLSLIDGQQRTSTFILLLKALLIRISDSIKEISKSGNKTSEPLNEELKDIRNDILSILYKAEGGLRLEILENPEKMKGKVIIKTDSINEPEISKNEIQTIVNAKDYDDAKEEIHKALKKVHKTSKKKDKYNNQFKNFKYFYDKFYSGKDASNISEFAKFVLKKCQVIEIKIGNTEQAIAMFNSLNSTGLPLSDSDIISAKLSEKIRQNGNESEFNKFNNDWKQIIESAKDLEIIDIDSVLTQYMYVLRAKKGDKDVTMPGMRRFFTEIEPDTLKNPKDFSTDLQKILDIWDTVKNHQIVQLALKFNDNIKLFLASYFYRFNKISESEIPDITNFCECIIRLFAILELVDNGYSSANFKVFLFEKNKKLVNGDIKTEEILTDFKDHINKKWKKEEIEGKIEEYDGTPLVYLNEYLFCKEKGEEFDISGTVNIEHIMPNSGKNIATIRKDANVSSEEEFNNIVNCLGNKILLEENINKSIGNNWFETKKGIPGEDKENNGTSVKNKKGKCYKDSKFAMAQYLSEYEKDKWETSDIEKATKEASDRIVKFLFSE